MKFLNNIGITQEIDGNGKTVNYTLKLKRDYVSKDSAMKDMRILQQSDDMYNFLITLKEHTDQPLHVQDMISDFLSKINGR